MTVLGGVSGVAWPRCLASSCCYGKFQGGEMRGTSRGLYMHLFEIEVSMT